MVLMSTLTHLIAARLQIHNLLLAKARHGNALDAMAVLAAAR